MFCPFSQKSQRAREAPQTDDEPRGFRTQEAFNQHAGYL